MKKVLLVYPPFCTPASPPYSITYIHSFLKNNCDHNIAVLDVNLEFHKLKFADYQKSYKDSSKWEDYEGKTKEYHQLTIKTYAENNKKIRNNEKPEFFDEMLKLIKDKNPDVVAFSLVYSSQVFYAYSLIKELKGVKVVIGGPAVNKKLIEVADESLANEIELLNFIEEREIDHDSLNFETSPDFSVYNLDSYFTPKPVIPLRTSTTCPYQGCSFCAHFTSVPYFEFPLELIKKTVVNSKQKYFFIIDDMIPTKRLLRIAEMLKPLNVNWTCQLRPTKDLDFDTLKTLRDSGLTMLIWGVESGNDRVLKLINKGTNKKDIAQVLNDSHKAGIRNTVYILFGFPTETEEELLETIDFLKENEEAIDLISVSEFGLQKGTKVYNDAEKYGIKNIVEEERDLLEPKISFETVSGLTREEVKKLKGGQKKTIENINKFPKTMNFFREHMFCSI
ncbi:MAG: radical SAM protein [Nanoarchaeota archaeon]|nr:radical SAM protein [Nanoarchaeota archaeon]